MKGNALSTWANDCLMQFPATIVISTISTAFHARLLRHQFVLAYVFALFHLFTLSLTSSNFLYSKDPDNRTPPNLPYPRPDPPGAPQGGKAPLVP